MRGLLESFLLVPLNIDGISGAELELGFFGGAC